MSCNIHSEKGFTLIEMSIVILIVGLLLAAYFPAYDLYRTNQKITETKNNVSRVSEYIGNFRRQYGRYPRPAPLDARAGSALFGREYAFTVNPTQALADFEAALNPNQCIVTDGERLCMQQSPDNTRRAPSLSLNGTPPANPGDFDFSRVMVGAVPFKDLGIPEEYSVDGYGNRLTYAVTAHLTDADQFDETNGAILIETPDGDSLLEEPAGAGDDAIGHYVVISHGANGYGAFTQEGYENNCPGYIDGDADNTFSCGSAANAGRAQYVYAEWDNTDSAGSTYDDYMMYSSKADAGVWQLSQTNTDNQHLIDDTMALFAGDDADSGDLDGAGEIGDGNLVLKNSGDLRVSNDVKASQFCDEDESNCFEAALFAGDPDPNNDGDFSDATGGQRCPAGQYVLGVRDGEIRCGAFSARCSGGEYVTGIDSDGELICDGAPPPDCPVQDVTVCSDVSSIGPAPDGDDVFVTGGDNRTHQYYCDEGTWNHVNSMGYCNCVDQLNATTTVNLCDTTDNIGGTRPYSGSVMLETVESCDGSGMVVVTTNITGGVGLADCTCSDLTDDHTLTCQEAGYGPGYSGGVLTQSTYDCDAGAWGSYVPAPVQPDPCVCNEGTEPRPDESCPAGLTGTVTVERVTTCPDGNVATNRNYSNCLCVDAVDITGEEQCDPDTENGSYMLYEDVLCGPDPSVPGTLTPRYVGSGCTPKSYRWETNSGLLDTRSDAGGVSIKEGISCTSAESGDQGSCWIKNFTGDYEIYNCECRSYN